MLPCCETTRGDLRDGGGGCGARTSGDWEWNPVVEYVQMAEAPAGERFRVIVAPPGSALDAGGPTLSGGAIGSLMSIVCIVAAIRGGHWTGSSG